MGRSYAPRFSRKRAKPLSFAKQPIADGILEVLATYRFLTLDLLTLLLGLKASWLQARLHRLYKFGYLNRFPSDSRKIIYVAE